MLNAVVHSFRTILQNARKAIRKPADTLEVSLEFDIEGLASITVFDPTPALVFAQTSSPSSSYSKLHLESPYITKHENKLIFKKDGSGPI